MEYASKGVANAGLTTGIIGSALGLLSNGGLSGILGGSTNSEDKPVTRYEAGMMSELAKKDQQIALLEANKYTDQKIADLYDKMNNRFVGVEQQLGAQAVWNATQMGTLGCLQNQIAQLQTLTKVVVPNGNVMPGWGNVTITPAAATTTTTTG